MKSEDIITVIIFIIILLLLLLNIWGGVMEFSDDVKLAILITTFLFIFIGANVASTPNTKKK